MHRIALILTALLGLLPSTTAVARRRAVAPPSSPVLAAVLGTEATATNCGSTSSRVLRCIDDQPCITESINAGETKRYENTGQVMRIGPVDDGKVNIESDGLTLPRTAFLRTTKIVPGAYDLNQFSQAILIISDHAGALGLKSVGPNGTTQEVKTVAYDRGMTRIDPTTIFLNVEPNFQFEITDTVGFAIEWTNKSTGTVTRIPAVRVEDALSEAYLARVTPNTTVMVKNALLFQQGGINLWFFPQGGIDSPQFGRGTIIMPYGMISITNVPSFMGGTGEGSLKLQGAPDAPVAPNYLPFFAWAITDGIAYALTRFGQAATAHGTGPNSTPYQNLVWTGLRTDATHRTELVLQSMGSLPTTGTLTLDDQGTPFAAQTLSFPGFGSHRINLDALAGSHAVYNATLQMHDDTSTEYPNHTPRATGSAIVTGTSGTTSARAPVIVPRTATAHYAMTADIQVWDGKQRLSTSATSRDERLMHIVTGTTTLSSRIGTFGYSNTNTNYQGLQEMLGRIIAGFQPSDYHTVFGETHTNLSPFLTDTDGDGWMIDCGPTDFTGDNTSIASGNQPMGVTGITYKIVQTTTAPYEVTATIRVRDGGQTFEQTTHPPIATILKLTNVNNPDALLGNLGYPCLDLPDPVVNSASELLANYANLTTAEQQAFSGDQQGFAPFARNGCDTSKNQHVLFIGIAVDKRASAQEYVDHFLLPLQDARVYLSMMETRCLLTGTCGVRSYAPDLAAIMQPSYSSSWPTPEALANQLRAWADGSDANGELFEDKDPFSYSNTGTLTVGFLLKPIGGAVPFHITPSQMSNVFAGLRSFLIDYVRTHPESYGASAEGGYRLSLNPTWSSQDPTPAQTGVYELRTDLFVVNGTGAQLVTTGTTQDERLMRVLYNVPAIQDALLGNYVQDNNNPAFQVLQDTLERIRTHFADADYRAVFNETRANLTPYFTDTDGDGYCIDLLSNGQDWQYDNITGAPGNNAQGTMRLQLQLTRAQQ